MAIDAEKVIAKAEVIVQEKDEYVRGPRRIDFSALGLGGYKHLGVNNIPEPLFKMLMRCEKCDSKMALWKSVRSEPDYQFPFSLCLTCGYTVVFERAIARNASKINLRAKNIIDFVNRITFGARVAGTKFEDRETVEKAINIDNLRFVSVVEEEEMVAAWVAEHKDRGFADYDTELSSPAIKSSVIPEVKSRLVQAQVNAEIRAKEKTEKNGHDISICRYCGKQNFKTVQAKNNHNCGGIPYQDRIAFAKKRAERLKEQAKLVVAAPDGGVKNA